MNKTELLDKLIRGLLTEEEKIQLEQLIQTDQEFKNLVDFETSTQEALKREKRKELKSYLRQVDSELKVDHTQREIILRPYLIRYAALLLSVVAVTALIFWMLKQDKPPETETPFLAYYEPYPNVVSPITRGEENRPEDIEKAAFLAYERQDYKIADSLFNQIIPNQEDYVSFYKGIVKFELQQYDSATGYFDSYIYSDGTQLRDQAKWYMALTYLVKGDTIKGKEELIRLRKSSGYKMDEVEQILLNMK
jgi:hypothetical protein